MENLRTGTNGFSKPWLYLAGRSMASSLSAGSIGTLRSSTPVWAKPENYLTLFSGKAGIHRCERKCANVGEVHHEKFGDRGPDAGRRDDDHVGERLHVFHSRPGCHSHLAGCGRTDGSFRNRGYKDLF